MNFARHFLLSTLLIFGSAVTGATLQSTIDPEVGASTTLVLNNAGLKTKHDYADENDPVITWLPGGLPATISTGPGQAPIAFHYAANGACDLLSITFPTFGPNAGSGQIGFTYDAANRILTLTDDTGTRTYAWSLGHPVSESWDTGPAIQRPLDNKRRLGQTIVKDGNTPLLTITPDYNEPSRELNERARQPMAWRVPTHKILCSFFASRLRTPL